MPTPSIRTLFLAVLLASPIAVSSQNIPTTHNEATVAQLQAEMALGGLHFGATDQGIHWTKES